MPPSSLELSATAPQRGCHRQLSPEQNEMSRQRSRVYYAQHKAKVLAKLKARYDLHRDQERARRRALYARNKAIRTMYYQSSSPSLHSLAFVLN
ncbi:hypothetical protein SPRG_14593 [Saprolegnia parasitica CBS 223.65]|uniref:Uncharacterized protein n=1 Tax=Saprolegnia parasitica (strain CBS 223.65) TaxID=695850 RepID=A0A067BPD1_SAPPC|nr:hypothetical protein SPRG_14593 [Saprolegnia parasitica CBS 223.65]KDO20113.1 hypothetical protein SPRG_14593 [Saprolegnia parasitica CBS 223.65]|eukprot:XP_012209157.1 hypothetical protein SPRG_14593 [Saprolegnia parasitica CBS 223.65]